MNKITIAATTCHKCARILLSRSVLVEWFSVFFAGQFELKSSHSNNLLYNLIKIKLLQLSARNVQYLFSSNYSESDSLFA